MGIAFHPAGEYRNFPMLLFSSGIKSNFKTSSSQKSTYTKLGEVCSLELTSYSHFELVSEGKGQKRRFGPNMSKKINTDLQIIFNLFSCEISRESRGVSAAAAAADAAALGRPVCGGGRGPAAAELP